MGLVAPYSFDVMNKPIDEANSISVQERARKAFEQIGYQQLNNVDCEVIEDEIVLRGVLDSFYLKQVAQSVAVKIPGVRSVKNEIEVR